MRFNYNDIIDELLSYQDLDFLKFNKSLIFTDYEMIGVRTPILRKMATRIGESNIDNYLEQVTRNYYEEVLLEGFLIGKIKDYKKFILYFNRFIPFTDNWAICDMSISSMKIINNKKEEMLKEVIRYLKSDNEFIVRVGIVILMDYYLDDEYIDLVFKLINEITLDKYYVNMGIAWLLSTSFIKYQDKTYKYLEGLSLNNNIKNMAIQKIRDSKRVSKEEKIKISKLKKC